MKRDYTTVSISNKHDKMLTDYAAKTKRDKKAQLELFIEQGVTA